MTALFISLLFSLLAPSASDAQGRLMGRVTDDAGKPLPAAIVSISGASATQASLTNAQGYYVFLTVPVGDYKLKAAKRGLAETSPRPISIGLGLTARLDVSFGNTDAMPIADAGKTKKETRPTASPVAKTEKKPDAKSEPVVQPITNAIDDEDLKQAVQQAQTLEDFIKTVPETELGVEGGILAIQRKVIYPETAKNLKIEGKVVAKIIVDASGSPLSLDLIKPAHELLNDEAIRVLSEETKFVPAVINGKSVPGAITIPITFKLGKVEW
ncbi:MAG: TonB family protein [Rhizobacter sp.]|nr:TonB family protein [Chlorobiales bacterium]